MSDAETGVVALGSGDRVEGTGAYVAEDGEAPTAEDPAGFGAAEETVAFADGIATAGVPSLENAAVEVETRGEYGGVVPCEGPFVEDVENPPGDSAGSVFLAALRHTTAGGETVFRRRPKKRRRTPGRRTTRRPAKPSSA